jgi:hypothetical protein
MPKSVVPVRTIVLPEPIPVVVTIAIMVAIPSAVFLHSDIAAAQGGRSQEQRRQRGKKWFFHGFFSFPFVVDCMLRSASYS